MVMAGLNSTPEPPADRIVVRPVPPGHRLVDDGRRCGLGLVDPRRLPLLRKPADEGQRDTSVAIEESAAADDRNAERSKVAGRHAAIAGVQVPDLVVALAVLQSQG